MKGKGHVKKRQRKLRDKSGTQPSKQQFYANQKSDRVLRVDHLKESSMSKPRGTNFFVRFPPASVARWP